MDSSTTTNCKCRISVDFEILRQTEVFSGVTADVVKLFAYLAKHRIYQAGQTILTQGAQTDCCYFVLKGQVDILTSHKGQEIVIQRIKAESFFGELALLAHFDWFFSARATTETELILIDRESFQKVLEKFPEKRDKLTENIIQLRVTRFQNQTVYLIDKLIEAGVNAGNTDNPLID